MPIRLPWLSEHSLDFPDPRSALKEPNGLLAAGGDLSVVRLLSAYRKGIFPWYSEGEPILWWSPDPRTVIFPGQFHRSRSLEKFLRKNPFTYRWNSAFPEVMQACSEPRPHQPTTWLSPEMKAAYLQLHQLGYAHSIECWKDQHLVGGLYGVVLGRCFFGESMFSRIDNASKAVMAELDRELQRRHFLLLDCQVHSPHLQSLGAVQIPRELFLRTIEQGLRPL